MIDFYRDNHKMKNCLFINELDNTTKVNIYKG